MGISGLPMRLWCSEVCEEKEIQPRRYFSDKFKLRIPFCGGQYPYGPPAGSPAPPPPGSAHRSPPASPQGAQCTDPVPRHRASAAAQPRLLGSLQPRIEAAAEAEHVEAAEQDTVMPAANKRTSSRRLRRSGDQQLVGGIESQEGFGVAPHIRVVDLHQTPMGRLHGGLGGAPGELQDG